MERKVRIYGRLGSLQVRQLMKMVESISSISLRSGGSLRDVFVIDNLAKLLCLSPFSPHHLLLLPLRRPSRPCRQALRFWRGAPPTHTFFLFTPDGKEWRVETRGVFLVKRPSEKCHFNPVNRLTCTVKGFLPDKL